MRRSQDIIENKPKVHKRTFYEQKKYLLFIVILDGKTRTYPLHDLYLYYLKLGTT